MNEMTTQPAAEAAPAPIADTDSSGSPAAQRTRQWFRYTLPGAWVALIFICLSFTPSLLPRPAFFQGFVCGLNGAIGYGIGVVGAWLWRQFADRPARPARRRSWRVFFVVGAVALIASYVLGLRWQLQIRELMSVPAEGFFAQLLLPVVGALIFVALVAAARGIRGLFRWVAERLGRWMGRRAARGVGWVLVAGLTFLLVSGVLLDGAIEVADSSFSVLDTTTSDAASQPETPLRSGGPESLVPWDTLGFQGRNFIGTGPTAEQIGAFTGAAAVDPIRAYAGIASAAEVEARAQLAVDDLERAGGFDRKYLLVAGTTGTGWVDPGAIDSLEYETGGDVASVAIQYSYLPSWVSFIVDQSRAREAGRALFDAVYDRWNDLPADRRPELLLFGVSLGSFSGEAAFSGEFDLRNRTDGALFAGPPNFNTLFREFTDGRDAGSPEVQPVFRDGRTVRFTDDPSGPISPDGRPWDGTRVLYLSHPSDPIVWWSTDLVLGRPDWLDEPAGSDVLDEMVWIPFVTFWQVTADMVEPVPVPQGHGHSYTSQYVDGWAQVIAPPGWSTAKADQLREIILAE
jgi:uncharacterized membrane protein